MVRTHVLATVSAKGHLMPKLTYHSTTIMLMLLKLSQTEMETYHFPASPNPHPDPLSSLYVIVRPRNLFHRILLFTETRKECLLVGTYRCLTVFELWPFEIRAQICTKRENPAAIGYILYTRSLRPFNTLKDRSSMTLVGGSVLLRTVKV